MEQYQKFNDEILQLEKRLKELRDERLPLADMLDKWGLIPKKKRSAVK